MRKTRRRINRDKKRIKLLIFLALFLLTLGLSVFAFFYFKSAGSSGLISPIPSGYDIATAASGDNSTEELRKKLDEKDIEHDKILKKDNAYIINLKNDSVVVIARDKDIDSQISSLQFILTRLTMEGRTFESLDLRYNKPIIRE
jgi:hypothetical protein